MPADETGSATRRTDAELAAMRSRCSRQAAEIETLSRAASAMKRGALALSAENSDLRAENQRLRRLGAPRCEMLERKIPLDVHAPGTARRAVAPCLAGQVAPSVLDTALLLVSELVTNSVRHSGVPEGDAVTVRVHLWDDRCRLEVEDGGSAGAVAPKPAQLAGSGGVGLNLVQTLSERWGVVRGCEGPTRVWAQLHRAAG